jgi:hypothetical protein
MANVSLVSKETQTIIRDIRHYLYALLKYNYIKGVLDIQVSVRLHE